MRPAILVTFLILLSAIDIASTWYLLNNVPGEEINPFVNTQSLVGIIFSPIPNLVDTVFLLCAFLAERRRNRVGEYIAAKSWKASLFLFPIYYLLMLAIVAFSHVMAVYGHSTPLSLLLIPFAVFTENTFIQYGLANSVIILVTLPLLARIATALYGTPLDTHPPSLHN